MPIVLKCASKLNCRFQVLYVLWAVHLWDSGSRVASAKKYASSGITVYQVLHGPLLGAAAPQVQPPSDGIRLENGPPSSLMGTSPTKTKSEPRGLLRLRGMVPAALAPGSTARPPAG